MKGAILKPITGSGVGAGRTRRRGSSLLRTAVVASATLAILLVCFSMYQYSLLSSSPAAQRPPRLPSPPGRPDSGDGETTRGPARGFEVGGAVVGLSQDITISLYPPEGHEARLELTVSDWSPRDGSDHEFLLRNPEVRMRTNDGNDVRVRAREGMLEARRKGGSGLEPIRGNLQGEVVIEFDRRTKEDKAKLPEAFRDKPDPGDLLRAECDAMDFDVEFGRLTIPGRLFVSARDVSLDATSLEARFDRRQGRVESLRIERGGRLELLDTDRRLRVTMPGASTRPERGRTIVEWLRETIESRAASSEKTASARAPIPERPAIEPKGDIPVFHMKESVPSSSTSTKYRGRFEGEVDARQMLGDAIQSRLQADVLEILREFSPDRERSTAEARSGDAAEARGNDVGDSSAERIVLTWTGRLTVETLADGDARWREGVRASVTATGAPARISHPDGDATCETLGYDPDGGEVRLYGSESVPAVVRASQQGVVTGRSVVVRREGDALDVTVAGPGRLIGDLSIDGMLSGALPSAGAASSGVGGQKGSSDHDRLREIEFTDEVRAMGRVMRKRALDFTGTITDREYRILEHVDFSGRTKLREGDTTLESDALAADFAVVESWSDVRQSIRRLVGTGNVVMTQGSDRMTCDEIDVSMHSGPDGRPTPRTAVATGNVSANQGDRTIEASEKVIVDFERVARTVKRDQPGDSPTREGTSAVRIDPSLDSASVVAPTGDSTTVVVPRRLRAFGGVSVIDPSQPLSVSCERIDCTINADREIESAEVVGRDESPATVRLDTFSATGREISLNVPDQWAEIPGRGRMTFESQKDLDGRKTARPVPIAITWSEWMKYRGRENRAVFAGAVHATSDSTTTFDCERLLVEFDDAPPEKAAPKQRNDPSLGAAGWISRLLGNPREQRDSSPIRGFTKEPRYIEATGNAIAHMAEVDPATGRMTSRSRIAGPKLSVHLRSELSKLLIEGPGNLQLEDFRPASPDKAAKPESAGVDIFAGAGESGPSKTLIQWHDRMWYDFSIDQTLFEGAVQLRHLSGEQLEKVFGLSEGATASGVPGRRTFLNCDVLTVDFLDRSASRRSSNEQRMGRLSSDRLRQFRAVGTVTLRDEVERLSLAADEVVYERPRKVLLIHGSARNKAQIVKQAPGRLPDQLSAERLFYNLATGQIEVVRASVRSGE